MLSDGEQALTYLHATGIYRDRVLPDIILLDLNLPRLNGYEVLSAVKSDAALRWIPVIVLSGSEATQDINSSYALGAASYLIKPGDAETSRQLVSGIEQIWFTLGRTPRSA